MRSIQGPLVSPWNLSTSLPSACHREICGNPEARILSHRLLADGFTVAITDVQAAQGEERAAEHGLNFLAQEVRDETRWSELIRDVEERFGRLDVLVNNAGIIGPTDAANPENARLEDWQRIFAVNVEGVFLGCRAAIPAMRRTGSGSIVNISSVAGLLATPYNAAYGASKAAVRQITKSVAQHCAEQKLRIRCNSVHPGDVRTEIWDSRNRDRAAARGVPFDDVVAKAQAAIPMGEFTTPEDIAAAVSFLTSDDSRHITGAKIIVDGGFVACDTFKRSP
jgi:3(or 17)beta-hydroxysteroid dehydrogenase